MNGVRPLDFLQSAVPDETGSQSQMNRLIAENEISQLHRDGSLWAEEPWDLGRSIAEGDFMAPAASISGKVGRKIVKKLKNEVWEKFQKMRRRLDKEYHSEPSIYKANPSGGMTIESALKKAEENIRMDESFIEFHSKAGTALANDQYYNMSLRENQKLLKKFNELSKLDDALKLRSELKKSGISKVSSSPSKQLQLFEEKSAGRYNPVQKDFIQKYITPFEGMREGGPVGENTLLGLVTGMFGTPIQYAKDIPPLSTTGKITPENLMSVYSALTDEPEFEYQGGPGSIDMVSGIGKAAAMIPATTELIAKTMGSSGTGKELLKHITKRLSSQSMAGDPKVRKSFIDYIKTERKYEQGLLPKAQMEAISKIKSQLGFIPKYKDAPRRQLEDAILKLSEMETGHISKKAKEISGTSNLIDKKLHSAMREYSELGAVGREKENSLMNLYFKLNKLLAEK
jgi:hypothetical protein